MRGPAPSQVLIFVVPRLVAAALLWDALSRLPAAADLLRQPLALAGSAGLALWLASAVLSALAVALASPSFYAAAMVVGAVERAVAGHGVSVPAISVAGLLVLSLFDSVSSTYSKGQGRFVKLEGHPLLTWLSLVATFLALLGFSVAGGRAVAGLYETLSGAKISWLGLSLSTFILYRLMVLLAVSLATVTVVSQAFEVVFAYLRPSRERAMAYLASDFESDAFPEPPLGSLKALLLSSFVSPLLYAPVDAALAPALASALSFLGWYAAWASSAILAATVYALAAFAIHRMDKLMGLGPLHFMAACLVLLAGVYAGGVYFKYAETGDLLASATSPDFARLSSYVASAYANYYNIFYGLVEYLPKLMGVAP